MLVRPINSEKEIIWKQGNHNKYEHTKLSLIESAHEQQPQPGHCSRPPADL